jgi:hypothetical protein
VNGSQRRNRFHFDDYQVLDDQINPIARLDFHPFVDDRHNSLSDVSKVPCRQFKLKAARVDRLEQSGAERSVHFDYSSQDFPRDLVEFRWVDMHGRRTSKIEAERIVWEILRVCALLLQILQCGLA